MPVAVVGADVEGARRRGIRPAVERPDPPPLARVLDRDPLEPPARWRGVADAIPVVLPFEKKERIGCPGLKARGQAPRAAAHHYRDPARRTTRTRRGTPG